MVVQNFKENSFVFLRRSYLLWFQLIFLSFYESEGCKYGRERVWVVLMKKKVLTIFLNVVFAFWIDWMGLQQKLGGRKILKFMAFLASDIFTSEKITFCSLLVLRVLILMHTLNKFIMHFFQFRDMHKIKFLFKIYGNVFN